MSLFQEVYTFFWVLACCSCLYIWLAQLEPFVFFKKEYWQFLLRPWKVGTFVVTTIFMVVIAPYSGDYTWDYVDGFFMSVLTFITAPWVVGIFYKFMNKKSSLKLVFLAFCLWMFSASWSYDIYLFFRDGRYPLTWLPNLAASSILYWSAGFFWNLGWNPKKGIYYSFNEDRWFDYYQGSVFGKILHRGWMFILLAGIILCGVVLSLNSHKP